MAAGCWSLPGEHSRRQRVRQLRLARQRTVVRDRRRPRRRRFARVRRTVRGRPGRRPVGSGGDGRMRRPPVRFHIVGYVFARVLQPVLVQYHVEHFRRTLGQLLGRHHLNVQMSRLRLAPGLDQPLQYLQGRKKCAHYNIIHYVH